MVVPRAVARFNRQVTNRVARRFAGRIPPFAVVLHRGRRTGKVHRTPVWAYPTDDGYAIALPYGPESAWVRNVLEAGRCRMRRAGRVEELRAPRVVDGPEAQAALPAGVRSAFALLGTDHVLLLRRASPPG